MCRGGCVCPPPVAVASLHCTGHGHVQVYFGLTRVAPLRCMTPFHSVDLLDVTLPLLGEFYTVSRVLSGSCWHVPVAPAMRPCLRFSILGTVYWFRTLPFGLNIAPRIFTKLVASVVRVMSSHGLFILAYYLDDLFLAAPSALPCQALPQTVLEILSTHGWIISLRDSRLVPSRSFRWLGLHWDLALYQAVLTDLCRVRLRQWIDVLMSQPTVSRRQVMQTQGLFHWGARTGFSVRPLMSVTRRELARTLHLSLGIQYPPPLSFRMDLASLRFPRFIPLQLDIPSHQLHIMSDASGVEWGIDLESNIK